MKRIQTTAIVLVSIFLVIGCSGGTTEATAQQTKAFDGGPMPPEAAERMRQGMERGRQRAMEAAQEAQMKAANGSATGQ